VRGEGWQWVEVRTSLSYTDRQAYDRCRTLDVDPTDEQQERLDAISALLLELEGKIDDLDPEADSEAIDTLEAQQQQAEAEREAIEKTLQQIDPRDLPLAGAVVYVDQRGELTVLRAQVRVEDRKAQATQGGAATAPGSTGAGTAPAKAAKADYLEKLLRQLTAHRTVALRATLADSPAIALRVLAYQLAVRPSCRRAVVPLIGPSRFAPIPPTCARKAPIWPSARRSRRWKRIASGGATCCPAISNPCWPGY
jgi:ParB family chromosome partitioning protein